MAYTLTDTYEYGLELLDKKGSDFVQLPEFFRFFKTAVLDFIGERIPIIEKTQQITNDLRPLMKTAKVIVIDDPEDSYAVISAVPNDCHHLVRANAGYEGNVTGRRPSLIRHGNIDAYKADPNQKPAMDYPLITQYQEYIKIDSGFNNKAIISYMTYIKYPTYADIGTPTQQIVDLDDVSIEDILNKTILNLMATRADDRTNIKAQQEQSFRHGNR